MLALNVPLIDAGLQRATKTRPKAVAVWLERLPFASPVEAAQQLITGLYALNRSPLDANGRHALLALYRPVVARVGASLETLLAESGVPPHARLRQTGVLLRELMIEFSIGYKHVLLVLSGDLSGRASPKRIAEVTARLLAALRDVQAVCCLTYSPLPAGLWEEIHTIFQFAQATHQPDQAAGDAPAASLAYRQALLLALADPPHLSFAELVHTRLYLDQFAALAELSPEPVSMHRGFPISTQSDTPPSHLPPPQEKGDLWLDTNALCRHLHTTAGRLRAGDSPRRAGLPTQMDATLCLTLCKHLLQLWEGGVHRAFKRYHASSNSVQMVAGVSAIHRLLEETSHAAELEPDEAHLLPFLDATALIAAPVAVHATRWTVSNDSASGLALIGTPDAPLNLKVGDPLAVRDNDAAGWSLAMIRWIRMRDARQVELGVERLAPQIHPVWVRPLRGHLKTNPEPALFIQGLPELQQNDRLLLPHPLYQADMDAEIWHAPNKHTLTFGRTLVHTPSFDLIDFTLFGSELPP